MRIQVLIISSILFGMMITKPSITKEDESFNRPMPFNTTKATTEIIDNTEIQIDSPHLAAQSLITTAQQKIELVKEKRNERDSLLFEIMRKKSMIDSLKRAMAQQSN